MILKHKGTLETYYETGMECLGLQLYLDNYEIPNKNYNPKDSNSGPEFFHDWSGVITLDKGDKVKILSSPLSQYEGKTFTVGILKWAAKDKYRLGAMYPFEEIPLQDWVSSFDCSKTRAEVEKKVKTIALYGGTFDPVHNGHKEIIDTLKYKYDLLLILPGNNWTKNKPPLFPLEQRINSLKAVCKHIHNSQILEWALTEDTSSTYSVIKKVKKDFGIIPHVVIGADNVDKIDNWKFWDKLKKIQFVVFNRKTDKPCDLSKFDTKPIFWNLSSRFESNEMSSTKIRETKDYSTVPVEALPYLDLNLLSQNNTNMIKK